MSRAGPCIRVAAAPPGALEAVRLDLDRRAFLRLFGSAAALGLLPSGCAPDRDLLGPLANAAPRALTPRGYAVLNAAALRIVGPRGAAAIRARQIDPARRVDAILERAPEVARVFGQALLLLEFGVFPLLGKLRPFTALDGPAQDAVLRELVQSRFETKRAIFGALKSFATLGFYGSPRSDALTGYPGPFGSERVPIDRAMTYDSEAP
ncbi:MAG: hypothetical protein JSU66_07760 [Deltaproteobacteria bacterium]|nr:MAG: hypothetical protein JSU66_07760 [Deltaproteobacteria bacterium]